MIGCEESGVVRRAFAARGIDTWSCDKLPAADRSNKHLQCDLRDLLGLGWAFLGVMHPPCTVLCNSGAKHLYIDGLKENGRYEPRWAEVETAAAFYRTCREAPIRHKAIENPVMHGHAIRLTGRGKTQFVHPYFFGEPFFKFTGFETINLPPLVPTNMLTPPKAGTDEHKAWSACHRAPPGPNRARDRSRTYQGIADAMADQWCRFIDPEPFELEMMG
ncbi:hypothetical protein D3Y57_19335 [Sphingomonas paeninsulae]|uniref:DNA cytosine methyltransferase n=1 Tax=Sphingomonas paeninsulae TaxID=2319844 RepID=A0A494TRN8_SPHPE|nr:hypothetical protein D3Y57_19335 [Sphingomonas paeninsulae]